MTSAPLVKELRLVSVTGKMFRKERMRLPAKEIRLLLSPRRTNAGKNFPGSSDRLMLATKSVMDKSVEDTSTDTLLVQFSDTSRPTLRLLINSNQTSTHITNHTVSVKKVKMMDTIHTDTETSDMVTAMPRLSSRRSKINLESWMLHLFPSLRRANRDLLTLRLLLLSPKKLPGPDSRMPLMPNGISSALPLMPRTPLGKRLLIAELLP
jgi:hypothetical protein